MPDDASLDDFVDASGAEGERDDANDERSADDGTATDEAETGAGGETAEDGDGDGETPTPAAATATWTPGGAACAACGTAVEFRWRDGETLVCGECKEW